MAAVVERRFEDAQLLCRTGENARANGAAYLVGFVIEILLKARLVRKFAAIARKRPQDLDESERDIGRLIWSQHDLGGMLDRMPDFEAALKARGERDGQDHVAEFKRVCSTWTIQARYSPHTMMMSEALDMLNRIRTLKELLK